MDERPLSKTANQTYRIILTDDHKLVRAGLRKLIENIPGLEIVAEAGNGQELFDILSKIECDLVILDLSMPGINGLTVIKTLADTHPHLRILVLTMHKDRNYFKQALAKNVYGYILKDDAYERLVDAIQAIQAGNKSYSEEISKLVMDDYSNHLDTRPSLEILTRREKEILTLIVQGKMNKVIAADLNISIRTVESHRARIMEKLGFNNVTELVKFAISSGLI